MSYVFRKNRRPFFLLLVILLTLFSNGWIGTGNKAFAASWTPPTTSGIKAGDQVVGVAFDPQRHDVGIIKGDQSSLITSNDGTNWSYKATSLTSNPNGIIYYQNEWVIAEDGGHIDAVSSPGALPNQQASHTTQNLHAIATDGQIMVAVGDHGTIDTYSGQSWSVYPNNTTHSNDVLYSVTYSNNHFVAVGMDQSTQQSVIYTSTNGTSWSRILLQFNTSLNHVTYGNGHFVASGVASNSTNPTVIYSSNGLTWYASMGHSTYNGLAYGGGQFVGVGDGLIDTSVYGINWGTSMTNNTTNYSYVTYDGAKFIVFDTSGNVTSKSIKFIVTYNGNGNTSGSAPVDQNTYLQGATVTVLSNSGNLGKTGYTFNGWNTKADGTGTSYTANESFNIENANMTLYAQWKPKTYTVTYALNGGTGSVTTVQADYNTLLTAPQDPTKTGYIFGGWYSDSGLSTAWDFANDKVTSDMTLYAKWTASACSNSPTLQVTVKGDHGQAILTVAHSEENPSQYKVNLQSDGNDKQVIMTLGDVQQLINHFKQRVRFNDDAGQSTARDKVERLLTTTLTQRVHTDNYSKTDLLKAMSSLDVLGGKSNQFEKRIHFVYPHSELMLNLWKEYDHMLYKPNGTVTHKEMASLLKDILNIVDHHVTISVSKVDC